MEYFVFDMDGVLVDSEPMHQRIILEVFQLKGIPFSSDYVQTLTGMSALPMWEKVQRESEHTETPQQLLEFHRAYFFDRLPSLEVVAVEGVKEVLALLQKRGSHIALASSSGRKLIDIFIEQVGIASYFEVIVSADDVRYSKPNPEIFAKVAAWYELPAEQFCVIEDSTNGVAAAKGAGMHCVGFQNPLSGGQDLSKADLVIHSMSELLQCLKKRIL